MTMQPSHDEDRRLAGVIQSVLDTQKKVLQAIRALSDEIQNRPGEFAVPFDAYFRLGDLVRVIRQSATEDVLITYASSLGNFRVDFGQISTRNDGNEVTGLNMGTDRMAQMRFSPITEFEVEIDNPSGVQQGRASTQRYTVLPYRNAPDLDPNEAAKREKDSQFWVWENDTPRFNLIPLVNATAHQLEAYADFTGWMYDFKSIGGLPDEEKKQAEQQFADGHFRVFRLNGRPA